MRLAPPLVFERCLKLTRPRLQRRGQGLGLDKLPLQLQALLPRLLSFFPKVRHAAKASTQQTVGDLELLVGVLRRGKPPPRFVKCLARLLTVRAKRRRRRDRCRPKPAAMSPRILQFTPQSVRLRQVALERIQFPPRILQVDRQTVGLPARYVTASHCARRPSNWFASCCDCAADAATAVKSNGSVCAISARICGRKLAQHARQEPRRQVDLPVASRGLRQTVGQLAAPPLQCKRAAAVGGLYAGGLQDHLPMAARGFQRQADFARRHTPAEIGGVEVPGVGPRWRLRAGQQHDALAAVGQALERFARQMRRRLGQGR